MAKKNELSAWGYLRRFFLAFALIFFAVLFLVWRIDNPRMEAIRFQISDSLPNLPKLYSPLTTLTGVFTKFRNFDQLTQENKELRRQLRQMEAWREAALQFEQINAELRSLNNLKFTAKDSYITADVTADSGSPYSKTALINVGADQKIKVGSPAIDGFGLIGRVIGVGETSSRLLLLNDPQSHISAMIMPDRIQAIVKGNNSSWLEIVLIDSGARILAGSRVVTSGDGTLPADLPIGYIEIDNKKQTHVKIAADYNALEFARILLPTEIATIEDTSTIIPSILPPETHTHVNTETNEDG